jgi:hypothetical protein
VWEASAERVRAGKGFVRAEVSADGRRSVMATRNRKVKSLRSRTQSRERKETARNVRLQMTRVQHQQMPLGRKHHVRPIAVHPIVLVKQEVEVLQRLRQRKALLPIDQLARVEVGKRGESAGDDGFLEGVEDLFADVEVEWVPSRAVEVPGWFDEFWSEWVGADGRERKKEQTLED